MQVRTVRAGAAEVVVREWGSAGQPPVVFWHGLNPFGALQLNEAGPAWASRGFRVLSIAAPGLADSPPLIDPGDYRPTRLADLACKVGDALGLGRFAFVGWSWGASIGVHLAVRHPHRLLALVLLDAGHTDVPGDSTVSLEEVLAELNAQPPRYRFASWDAFVDSFRAWCPPWRPALEKRLRAGMIEDDGAIVARSSRRDVAAAWRGLLREQPSSVHEALGALDLPVLLVRATRNDTAEETAQFRGHVQRVDVVDIDSEHDLFAFAPEATAEAVADWLGARLERPA